MELSPAESIMATLPGGESPVVRTLYGVAIGAGITFGVKPSIAFREDGSERPFILFSNDKDATITPYWMLVALPALFMGMLI